ncbi:hypothetical protein KIW84_040538 [Lathyrus oleraceus]|uniref:Auxin efflux carrier component n=1 Tax=Pisum sativum TaxID=3888 RepID=A0A9D5AQ80_PEA|nr:hypothetical protein KIW84_040538 [Pisum sativum]
MITVKDIYDILTVIVPLYVAMLLAYCSVRWWKYFTPEQCSGISRFISVFVVPLLAFHFIASNDPYAMNYRFLAADTLQKVVTLVALFLWNIFTEKQDSFGWTITLFSLSSLPNSLIVGVPLLKAMYGDFSGTLMIQIVVMQSVIWCTVLLFLFEYRAAKLLISQQFPETAASITSFKVDPDLVSLNNREPLQTDAEIGEDGKIRVVVRRSTTSSMLSASFNISHSNLSSVEIYSVQSSRDPTPRASTSINQNNSFQSIDNDIGGEVYSIGETPRSLSLEDGNLKINKRKESSLPGVNELIENTGSEEGDVGIEEAGIVNKNKHMPPATVIARLILIMVWRKLIRNPNTYASIIGLVWSLIAFRWHIEMPSIIQGCFSILANGGLGLAMFSLGLSMALQPKLIPCGKRVATFSMAVRFLAAPAVTAATSLAVGLRGVLLHFAIVQAALPQGIVPFVYAKEYNLHSDIISVGVIFGMLISLPVTTLYYVLLGL